MDGPGTTDCGPGDCNEFVERNRGLDHSAIIIIYNFIITWRYLQIQTEALPTEIERCDDHQLAAWLRKIFPFVERELLKGPTKVASDVFADDYATASDLHYLELTAHQVISVQSCAADNCTEVIYKYLFRCWLLYKYYN